MVNTFDEMVSFLDLPLDLVALISIRSGVGGWLALFRTCRRFATISGGVQRKVILSGLTIKEYFPTSQTWNTQTWKVGGKCHRDATADGNDLPAQIWADGAKYWYHYGVLHRDHDLPAYIGAKGDEAWYRYGKRHRVPTCTFGNISDLPAVILASGSKQWWVNGNFIK